jgi:hypothetical protein
MSLDSVREETLTYFIPKFNAAMNIAFGSVPKIWTPNTEETNTFPFIKFTFIESESHNAALNKKLVRYIGFVQVDVIVEENTGSKTSNTISQSIKDILENIELTVTDNEYITYLVGRAQETDSVSGRYKQVVRIPYRRDVLA